MTKKEEKLVFDTPQAIAELFGCPTTMVDVEDFPFYKKLPVKNRLFVTTVRGNTSEVCRTCGRIAEEGFLDPKRLLIGDTTNTLYTWADTSSDFHCYHCVFNYKSYAKKLQGREGIGSSKVVGDMADVVIFPTKIEYGDFLSTSKDNKLYEIFKSPPKEPFVLMLKKFAGTSIVDMAHTSLPTIDTKIIVVNYGNETFRCPRKKTLECIRDGDNLIKKFNSKEHKVSDDIPFNRQTGEGYNDYLTQKLRMDEKFMKEYSSFVSKYDKGIRFVSKIMLKTYRTKLIEKTTTKGII